jgi:hypothetical protein
MLSGTYQRARTPGNVRRLIFAQPIAGTLAPPAPIG